MSCDPDGAGAGAGVVVDCPVCLVERVDCPAVLTPCGHGICLRCAVAWVTLRLSHRREPACPACNGAVERVLHHFVSRRCYESTIAAELVEVDGDGTHQDAKRRLLARASACSRSSKTFRRLVYDLELRGTVVPGSEKHDSSSGGSSSSSRRRAVQYAAPLRAWVQRELEVVLERETDESVATDALLLDTLVGLVCSRVSAVPAGGELVLDDAGLRTALADGYVHEDEDLDTFVHELRVCLTLREPSVFLFDRKVAYPDISVALAVAPSCSDAGDNRGIPCGYSAAPAVDREALARVRLSMPGVSSSWVYYALVECAGDESAAVQWLMDQARPSKKTKPSSSDTGDTSGSE